MTKPRLDRVAVLLVLSGPLTGCSDSTPPVNVPTGVLEVTDAPTMILGDRTARPEAALHMVSDAVRLVDGTIAVANGGLDSRLPVFSPDGSYIRTIGRQGEGPGEFRWITSLQSGLADSVYVYDAQLQRLTAVAPDGGVRTTSFRVTGSGTGADGLRVVEHLSNGVWVGRGSQSPRLGAIHEVLQDTVAVGLMTPDLERFQVVERIPALMSVTFELGSRGAFGAIAFTPTAIMATRGRCVFIAGGGRRAISVFSSSGNSLGSFEGPRGRRLVTPELRRAWIEHRVGGAPSDQKAMHRVALEGLPFLEELPYHYQMVIDHRGTPWLQPWEPPMGLGREWFVLESPGVWRPVRLPRPMRIHEIGPDGLLGTTTDELDTERIELLPIDFTRLPGGVPVEGCV